MNENCQAYYYSSPKKVALSKYALLCVFLIISGVQGGVDISANIEWPESKYLRRNLSEKKIEQEIKNTATEIISDPALREAVKIELYKDTVYVRFHPAVTPLEFKFEPKERISFYTKTSTAGPGYHAFTIEFLDHLSEKLGKEWKYEYTGESMYQVNRDFSALQTEMATMLKNIMKHMLHNLEDASTILINYPIDYPKPVDAGFSVTPLGYFSKEWLTELSQADGEALNARCSEFLPWWNKEMDALFYRNFGLALLWSEIAWHVPHSEKEAETYYLALHCFKKARQLEPEIDIPEKEISEVETLLQKHLSGDDSIKPREEGIGFARLVCTHDTIGHWSIKLPGYYYTDYENEGKTMVFWFNDRTVRISSYDLSTKDNKALSNQEMLDEWEATEKKEDAERIDFTNQHLQGKASISRASEEGREFWVLSGCVTCGQGCNSLCIVTICYDNPEDKDWAVSTFKSFFRAVPR
jgi:hypothetical protein